MKPYERYKDSGVEWLGEVPEHWEMKKLKFVIKQTSNRLISKGNILNYIGMENVESETGRFVEFDAETEGLANYFRKNNILFGKLRPYLAKVHVAESEGICSTEFIVYNTMLQNSHFIQKLLLSKSFINVVDASTYGSKMPRANADFIGNLYLPIPPLPEQQKIADFLDRKCEQIDCAIQQKEKLIALLNERRQIAIQHAVTRGLNPDVKLKDSGVEWIGEIPEHWEVKRLKYIIKQTSIKQISKGNTLNYIGMENIESETGRLMESVIEVDGLANYFEKKNILFGKLRPYLTKVYLSESNGICSTEFIVYDVMLQNPHYIHKLLLSKSFINIVDASTYGSKMPRANADFIGNLYLPIPPPHFPNNNKSPTTSTPSTKR